MLNFFTPAKGKEAWTCPFCPQGKMTIPLRWPKKGGLYGGGETRAKQTEESAKVNIVTCGIEPVKTETLP